MTIRRAFPRLKPMGLVALLSLIAAAVGYAAPPRAPKLVVILVVDQLRADYLEKSGKYWTGGLRRLMTQGAWFRQAAYPYMNTATCVGHSTIVTGSLPATHAIVNNSWFDRETGRSKACVADPDQTLVSYGAPAKGGTSTKNLLVPGLPDEMRAQLPVAPRIVTFSLKDYTATTLAGRRADAATWVNSTARSWVTSSAFTPAPVPFLVDFIKAHPIEADFNKSWTRLLPPSAYHHDDQAKGERTLSQWTESFPHVLKGKSDRPDADFFSAWVQSPFSDAYLAAMAESAVDALKMGQGQGIDYLAVSFSALDGVGHAFGPRSHEEQDVLAHLDRTLGSLLDHLDRRVGPGNYVLALTGDHGVSPVPEQVADLGFDAGRVSTPDLVARIEKALEPSLGSGSHVARMASGDVYFAPGVWDRIRQNPAVMDAVLGAIRSTPGIARVFRGDELRSLGASADDRLARVVANSYYPGRSGDLVVVPRPYFLFASDSKPSSGTSHGNAYWYDQRVPVILFGQGIRPGQYLQGASPMDIAPTLAFLCGITLPAADGRVLAEALQPNVGWSAAPVRTTPHRR